MSLRLRIIYIIPLLLIGCATSRYEDFKDDNLSIRFSRDYWKKIDPNRADIAFENQKEGSIITLNSFCRKFQNESLDSLAQSALSGIKNLKYQKQKVISYSKREAYELQATGELDGVSVAIKFMNFRKNNCYYDIFLLSPQELTKEDEMAFKQFTQNIRLDD